MLKEARSSRFTRRNWTFSLLALLVVVTLSGCAGVQRKTGPVFFPPPPDQPRVQFLKAINSSEDIEGKKSGFALFLFGTPQSKAVLSFNRPYGVTSYKGKIYVCDVGGGVVVIDPEQKTFELMTGDTAWGKIKKPIHLTFDEQGNMYVADVVRKEVLVFSPERQFIKAIGKEELKKPVDVLVDKENIYVLDLGNNAIKVFDRRTDTFVKMIGKTTEDAMGLSIPANFTEDAKGVIHATNIGAGNVMKFDKDGHLLSSFGKLGDGFGEFSRPKGIAIDPEGRIYVVDAAHQNVQIFNDVGRLLMFFGNPGLPEGSLNLPAGIYVTKENLDYFKQFADPSFEVEFLIFVTNQNGDAKLSVYGFGHQKEGFGTPKGSMKPAKSEPAKPADDEKKSSDKEKK